MNKQAETVAREMVKASDTFTSRHSYSAKKMPHTASYYYVVPRTISVHRLRNKRKCSY